VAKAFSLAGLVLLGFTVGRNASAIAANFGSHWSEFWRNASWSSLHPVQVGAQGPIIMVSTIVILAVVQTGSLFSADAWNNVTFTAGEIKNPRRNVPLSLAFGVGFVLVDMRTKKLFKRLLATPMHHGDFLLSLLSARMLFLAPEMVSLLILGFFMFGVPLRGSLVCLIFVIIVGALAFAGIGLLVGSRTEKSETASGLINLVMLPQYLLSGIFFSATKFPDVLQPFIQPVIQALPLTQLNDALREVMLEGASWNEVAWRLGVLASWAGATFFLALRWFRWR